MSASHDDRFQAFAERQGDHARGLHGNDFGYAPTVPMPLAHGWEPTQPMALAHFEPTMPAPLTRR